MGSWDKRADMLVHEVEPFNAEPPAAALGTAFTTAPQPYGGSVPLGKALPGYVNNSCPQAAVHATAPTA